MQVANKITTHEIITTNTSTCLVKTYPYVKNVLDKKIDKDYFGLQLSLKRNWNNLL